jgi:hypothetical protein
MRRRALGAAHPSARRRIQTAARCENNKNNTTLAQLRERRVRAGPNKWKEVKTRVDETFGTERKESPHGRESKPKITPKMKILDPKREDQEQPKLRFFFNGNPT